MGGKVTEFHLIITHKYHTIKVSITLGEILNGRCFVDSILKFILLYEYECILIEISQKFIPMVPFNSEASFIIGSDNG